MEFPGVIKKKLCEGFRGLGALPEKFWWKVLPWSGISKRVHKIISLEILCENLGKLNNKPRNYFVAS